MNNQFEVGKVVYLGNRRGRVKRAIPTDQEDLYEIIWDDGKEDPKIVEASKLKREPADGVSYKQCPLCKRTGGKVVVLLRPNKLDNPTEYRCFQGHTFKRDGHHLIFLDEGGKEKMIFDIAELEGCPWDELRKNWE
jgi:hypothetical protein